jgi:hypothetical protein
LVIPQAGADGWRLRDALQRDDGKMTTPAEIPDVES